jgi:hypothetical protein
MITAAKPNQPDMSLATYNNNNNNNNNNKLQMGCRPGGSG